MESNQIDLEKYIQDKNKSKVRKVQVKFDGQTETKQEYKQESDVNFIIKRYQATGMFPQARGQALYQDVSQIPDYKACRDTVIEAQEHFNSLPAAVRSKFKNDPAEMLEWAKQIENREAANELNIFEEIKENKAEPTKDAKSQEKQP